MAKSASVGLDLCVMLFLAFFLALTGATTISTDANTAATDCLTANVTSTVSAALMPRGGTAENLPDDGDGPSPGDSHMPGGPYSYGDYCESIFCTSNLVSMELVLRVAILMAV